MSIHHTTYKDAPDDGQKYARENGTWVVVPPGGVPGAGVPIGGIQGQHLAKIDATDYNTEWVGDGLEADPIDPDFTYTSEILTRIDYSGGEYKVFTYSGGRLDQVDYVSNGLTKRKVLTYGVGGELDYITQSFV